MDPVWAAILGGAVGGVIVAVVESFLGRSREHQRWLRDRRQRAYSEFLDIAHRTLEVHNDIWFRAKSPRPDEPVVAKGPEMLELFKELSAAVRRMDLIATPAMRDRAFSLMLNVGAFGEAFEQYISGAGDDPMAGLEVWQIEEHRVIEFSDAARRELGAGRDIRYRLRRRVRRHAQAIRTWWRKRR